MIHPQGRGELDLLPWLWVDQLQTHRMEGLAPKTTQGLSELLARTLRDPEPATVSPIPDQRVSEVGHMHPDLVSAAGLQGRPEVRVRPESLDHTVMGHSRPSALPDRHPQPVAGVSANRRVDSAPGCQHAIADSAILTLHGALLQLPDKVSVVRDPGSDHHHAAGVLVQSMDDPGTRYFSQLGAVVQERVLQGASGIAGARMDDQPGRLVDDDDGLVLVQHLQTDGLRLYRLGRRRLRP